MATYKIPKTNTDALSIGFFFLRQSSSNTKENNRGTSATNENVGRRLKKINVVSPKMNNP